MHPRTPRRGPRATNRVATNRLATNRLANFRLAAASAAVGVLALTGCVPQDAPSAVPSGSPTSTEVVLVTHSSFALTKSVLDGFTKQTGIKLTVIQDGDVGQMVNKAILTAGSPAGDVMYGIDNTFLGKAAKAGVLLPYRSPAAGVDPALIPSEDLASPIDTGYVCVNADAGYFAEKGLTPPASLEDLAKAEYRGLLVAPRPTTSSPGLAFMLATRSRFGDGWLDYWKSLQGNGIRLVDSWDAAYYSEFSGGSGKGTRPLVVSYSTSPAAEVMFAEKPPATPPTANVPGTCFTQVEYAAVLKGAKHPDAAAALIRFLQSEAVQADIPGNMFVFPVLPGVPVPPAFDQTGARITDALSMTPEEIDAGRDEWVGQWVDLMDSP